VDLIIVQNNYHHRNTVLALLLSALVLAGCGATASDLFNSDLLSKDAEWFSRSGRVFVKSVSIDTPPLTPDKPVTPADLVSTDGACPGVASAGVPTNANALSEGGAATVPTITGAVALGHTECDVVRGLGAPDGVNISNNPRGERVAVINFSHGLRPGIYTFTAGRLTSVERGAEPAAESNATKPKKKKPAPI
jgi:outer membrane lipoprotein SlyB